MSWFKIADLAPIAEKEVATKNALSFPGDEKVLFVSGNELKVIKNTIGALAEKQGVFFITDGAWSNIQLLEYLLELSGPANLYFTTWSISEDAIRRFTAWKESGQVRQVFAILDQGIRNRKPEIYQQACAAFSNLKFDKCHAKITVIEGSECNFVLIGSANYTRNPRKECGTISRNKELSQGFIDWFLKEVGNGSA